MSDFGSLLVLAKVPILKEVNFGKMQLCRVEHFFNIFVFTFEHDCYCIQQSRPKVRTNMLYKCSIFPKFTSFKIGTLETFQYFVSIQ